MLQTPFANRRLSLLREILGHVRHKRLLNTTYGRKHEALRVLFCGSDNFSVISLQRLSEESRKRPDLIASIEVLCKRGKRVGRGLKKIRDVPIKAAARNLHLPTYEITTFTGWSPPEHARVDLIVAVSFGLLIPSRILKSIKYGGINIHPSLLPDLQGPAPLHQALLEGRKSSGITAQTLHPTTFDRGVMLKQRSFDLPNDGECSIETLQDYVAPQAADLLIECLLEGSFTGLEQSKHVEDGEFSKASSSLQPEKSYATKLNPNDSCIDWQSWDSGRILRVQRALGSSWSFVRSRKTCSDLRIRWHGLKVFTTTVDSIARSGEGEMERHLIGEPCILNWAENPARDKSIGRNTRSTQRVAIKTRDNRVLTPESVTVEGRRKYEDPVQAVTLWQNGKI